MAKVQYREASRIYPGNPIPAVNDLTLDVGYGEFMVLVGPSGSGKSTALRMLAGLEDIDTGEVRIGGKDVSNKPPKDRDIAMVFQNYALYPHTTVAENMGFALKLKGVRRHQRDERYAPRPSCWTWNAFWIASRRRCPAGSGSASRWAGRSSASRPSSS